MSGLSLKVIILYMATTSAGTQIHSLYYRDTHDFEGSVTTSLSNDLNYFLHCSFHPEWWIFLSGALFFPMTTKSQGEITSLVKLTLSVSQCKNNSKKTQD